MGDVIMIKQNNRLTFTQRYIRTILGILGFIAFNGVSGPSLLGQSVIGTINRPGLAPSGLVVYERGNKLCVFDDRANNLLIYNGESLALTKEITFNQTVSDPFSLGGMAVNEKEGNLYILIGVEGTYPDRARVVVIDLTSESILSEITIPGLLPQSMNGFAYDQEIGKIFLTNSYQIFTLDLGSNVVTTINLPDAAHLDLSLNPVTHELFIANLHDPILRIVNGITNQLSEVVAVKAFGMTVNWLENKVYIIQALPYRCWIYDRGKGSTKIIDNKNDAEHLIFNPGSNLIYTNSEIGCRSTIIDGATDQLFNLPMESGTSAIGFRHLTKHTYYVGNHFIAVYDDCTDMLIKMDFDHPHSWDPSSLEYIAVNQATGRIYAVSTSFYDPPEENPIWVFQDNALMTQPNLLLGSGQCIGILDPFSYSTLDLWGLGIWGNNQVDGIAYRPSGGRVYVASSYYSFSTLSVHTGTGAMSKYGTNAGNFNACVGSLAMNGHHPVTPVVSPDGKKIYITCSQTNLVQTIDITVDSSLTVVNETIVGESPWGAALTPDGTMLYVANKGSNSVSVINAASGLVTATVPSGQKPWGVAINPSGSKVYVANSGSGTVTVIKTGAEIANAIINVGLNPHWLGFTPDGKLVFVGNSGDGTVSVIDTGTDSVVRTITVGTNPEGIAAQPDGSRIYVANSNKSGISSLSIINLPDFSVIQLNPDYNFIGVNPIAMADPTSKIAGCINVDEKPFEGAVIRALQNGTQKGRAISNAAGDYCIFNLNPGAYDIEAVIPDQPAQLRTSQQVEPGATIVNHFNWNSSTVPEIKEPESMLLSNYPNPFSGTTIINYSLSVGCEITVAVFDQTGKLIRKLVDCNRLPGSYKVEFDGSVCPPGVYIYKLTCRNKSLGKTMILQKQ
jgi:YVTN family beta-propeller protein